MEYIEALEYLKNSKSRGIMLGLERVKRLLEGLGNPQEDLKIIHVAGTNGKGSVCNMTRAALTKAGYKTGQFTSPVVYDFREQFVIDGEFITEAAVAEMVEKIKSVSDKMDDAPTEFEMLTAMSFLYFKEEKCDFAVIEVGMGGIEDATNVIKKSEVSVIVNIDYDHMNFLGSSLLEIAEKKAGIIKPECDVVIADQDIEVIEYMKKVCEDKACKYAISDNGVIKLTDKNIDGTVFDYKEYQDIKLSLIGEHQTRNAAVVLEIMTVLKNKGYNISKEIVKDAFMNMHLPGRFDIISKEPLFIVDGSHNPHGIKALTDNLDKYFAGEKFNFIVGILGDKDYTQMIKSTMRFAQCYIVTKPDSPRALEPADCAKAIRESGFEGEIIVPEDHGAAIKTATDKNRENSKGICAFGSLYNVYKIMTQAQV